MDSEPVITPREVQQQAFVEMMISKLENIPAAAHPVQYERISLGLVACTLCGAAVSSSGKWQELHRKNHDEHNKVHSDIDAKARRYTPPPRYG